MVAVSMSHPSAWVLFLLGQGCVARAREAYFGGWVYLCRRGLAPRESWCNSLHLVYLCYRWVCGIVVRSRCIDGAYLCSRKVCCLWLDLITFRRRLSLLTLGQLKRNPHCDLSIGYIPACAGTAAAAWSCCWSSKVDPCAGGDSDVDGVGCADGRGGSLCWRGQRGGERHAAHTNGWIPALAGTALVA